MEAKINKVTVQIMLTNIMTLDVDGLVNATEHDLTLSDELAEMAGPDLESECRFIGWCEIGSAIITGSGNLTFKKIIHTVGPRWGDSSARGKLANATWATLKLAEENELRSIAVPPISTGAFGYPVENCAKTMLEQIIDFTFEKLKHLRTIIICVKNEAELEAFTREFQRQLEELKDTGDGKVRV